ncbi:MAG: deoxyribodipyrimidine photo-lyase [Pseudobdellovibrionaceae bacterium]
MSKPQTIIVWFRQDLRRADNPALHAAYEVEGARILPVFIHDDDNAKSWKRGAASNVWLHHSLASLNTSLSDHLALFKGKADEILPDLVKQTGATAVYWNRCYEPWRMARDTKIKQSLKEAGITVETFKANLLWEPWEIKTGGGTPYQVFTPFYKKGCLAAEQPRAPLPAPERLIYEDAPKGVLDLDDLQLLPVKPRWDEHMLDTWDVGEAGAWQRLDDFLDAEIDHYAEGRDRPDKSYVSRLSPHLHFGEISPRMIWHEIEKRLAANAIHSQGAAKFQAELAWREFSYHLLYHFKERITDQPLNEKFKAFPWEKNEKALAAWQKGLTGYPIVDAGMRQLWQEGYMHNRVRMIAASFLIKDLLIHWSEGEKWFWDTLFDADLANNSASWQWVAGCGADAAPYFRIFNPVLQGEKFDPNGDYVRKYVPELKDVPDKYVHKPWEAPAKDRPKNYPAPLVDHKAARDAALDAYEKIKKAG